MPTNNIDDLYRTLQAKIPKYDFASYYKKKYNAGLGALGAASAISALGVLGQNAMPPNRQRNNTYLRDIPGAVPQQVRDYNSNNISRALRGQQYANSQLGYGFGRTAALNNSAFSQALEAISNDNARSNATDIELQRSKALTLDKAANEQVDYDFNRAEAFRNDSNKKTQLLSTIGSSAVANQNQLFDQRESSLINESINNQRLQYETALQAFQFEQQRDMQERMFGQLGKSMAPAAPIDRLGLAPLVPPVSGVGLTAPRGVPINQTIATQNPIDIGFNNAFGVSRKYGRGRKPFGVSYQPLKY